MRPFVLFTDQFCQSFLTLFKSSIEPSLNSLDLHHEKIIVLFSKRVLEVIKFYFRICDLTVNLGFNLVKSSFNFTEPTLELLLFFGPILLLKGLSLVYFFTRTPAISLSALTEITVWVCALGLDLFCQIQQNQFYLRVVQICYALALFDDLVHQCLCLNKKIIRGENRTKNKHPKIFKTNIFVTSILFHFPLPVWETNLYPLKIFDLDIKCILWNQTHREFFINKKQKTQ